LVGHLDQVHHLIAERESGLLLVLALDSMSARQIYGDGAASKNCCWAGLFAARQYWRALSPRDSQSHQ
jgi:hypothetical protein